ncbi:Calx-beta domain-containing protein [Actinokineospora sp. NBRC 105648]|uniref:Calx-beta domain-containing protein n=1 Tax=Actinokineospora sp. NBRC 105648 TaxID=3032206 RepID=UPI0024A10386|nr:Calx-beta domain-containing protein [Actinokineospora sp. NBRC 105648]GLZ41011.1 hyalin [Actinokineospora sp. NBRC 105648]
MRKTRRTPLILTAAILSSLALTTPATADPGVTPSTVDLTLAPGATASVGKTVRTSEVPQNPDLVLLADTTGSMGGAIGNVRANAGAITADVLAAQPTARFGVAEFKDIADAIPFRVNQQLTGDPGAVQAGINQWAAGGGGDFPEDQINALYRIATGDIAFRPGSTRIVAIFGDAPSHDPSGGHTLAAAIAALNAASVRVIAVNVGNLDSAGQATALVNATGGVLLNNVPSNQVSQAILDGIRAIQVTVEPVVTTCAPQLTLTNSPTSVTVTSGDAATFAETVAVSPSAAPGDYTCQVDYLVGGVSQGFVETTTVRVLGLSVNDVTLVEPDSGPATATFTVSLTGPSPSPVTVDFVTANASATAPADYTAATGSLTFAPGELSRPVAVTVLGDTLDELTENFRVTLANATGAGILRATGTGTITDGDRDGGFTCAATAAAVLGSTAAAANPPNNPCATDSKLVPTVSLLGVRVDGLSGSTDLFPANQETAPGPGDGAQSEASVNAATVSLLGLANIQLGDIHAEAGLTCVAGPGGLTPVSHSSSSVATLRINGAPITVGTRPLTIPLVVGSLRLNSSTEVNGQLVRQAVVLDTPLTRVVLAEVKVGLHGTATHPAGNPCRR